MAIYENDIKHNQSVVYKILAMLVCKVFVLQNDCFILISSTHIPYLGSVCIKIGRFNCWGHWSTFRSVPLESRKSTVKVLLFHIRNIYLYIYQQLSSKRYAMQLKTTVTTCIIDQWIIIILIFVAYTLLYTM